MLENQRFESPSGGSLTLSSLTQEIAKFVQEEPRSFYRLVIGTDSQTRRVSSTHQIDFVSAIVIHRIGRGGRYFWRKIRQVRKPILRDKIYTETLLSIEIAHSLVPRVRKVLPPGKYDLEIHIDVGPLGETRDMIKEVVGMVVGNGYVAKTKPDSWGASSVADKHT